MTHKESRERSKAIAAEIEAGMPTVEAMKKFDVSRSTISAACRVNRVKMPGMQGALPRPKTYQMIADLINTDDSFQKIADRNDVSPQRVQQIHARCLEAGVPVRVRQHGGQNRRSHDQSSHSLDDSPGHA